MSLRRVCVALFALWLGVNFARPASALGSDGVGAPRVRTAAGIRVRTIEVDPHNPRIRVSIATAQGFPRHDETFGSMLGRVRPIVAIDGAYFSERSRQPIGDIVVNGRLRYAGMMGTALAMTRGGDATIERVVRDHRADWTGYDMVLGCGPALVLDGSVVVNPVYEHFHDPHVMHSTRRLGIAVLGNGDLLIVETVQPVNFLRWARVMRALGAQDALNLDAGASLAMTYRGHVLEHPKRRLTNLFVILPRS
jgi:exopolysaccharide biosynthesis protein